MGPTDIYFECVLSRCLKSTPEPTHPRCLKLPVCPACPLCALYRSECGHSPTHTNQKPASPLGYLRLCQDFIQVLLFEIIDIFVCFSYYLQSDTSTETNPNSALPTAPFTSAVSSLLPVAVRRIETLPVCCFLDLLCPSSLGPDSSCTLTSFIAHAHALHICMALF